MKLSSVPPPAHPPPEPPFPPAVPPPPPPQVPYVPKLPSGVAQPIEEPPPAEPWLVGCELPDLLAPPEPTVITV